MQKTLRGALLGGAGVVTMLAAMPHDALAQSVNPGFFGAVSGWYMFTAGRNTFTKGGDTFTDPFNHPDDGPGGKVYLGYRFNGPFDVAAGVQGTWLGSRKGPFDFGPFNDVTSKAHYWAVDGEVGYNTMVAGAGVRLFAGLRYAQFDHRNKISGFTDGTGTFFKHLDNDYWGIGPRVGFDISARLFDSNFSVFSDVAGSVLFGKLKRTLTVSSPPCMGDCSDSEKDSQTVWNVEGQLGVAYEFSPGINLGVGYRAEYWNNVADSLNGSTHTDRFMHGPFVRVSYNFGPPPAMPMAMTPPPGQPPVAKKSFIVFFDFDKSTITAQAQKTIDDAAAAAKAGQASQVTLTGHADRAGSDQYNLALSLRRAEAVKASLIKLGVPASLIVVIGKGESQPLVPTADGVREPQNRRVEILI